MLSVLRASLGDPGQGAPGSRELTATLALAGATGTASEVTLRERVQALEPGAPFAARTSVDMVRGDALRLRADAPAPDPAAISNQITLEVPLEPPDQPRDAESASQVSELLLPFGERRGGGRGPDTVLRAGAAIVSVELR